MQGTDWVIPWINPGGPGSREREDLKFALRSLERYWVGNVRVTIIGDDPGFTHLWHASHQREATDDHPKALDAVRKMEAIIGLAYVQERFAYGYDDTYLLRPVDELYLSRRRATKEIPADWNGTVSTRKWSSALANTVQVLRDNGFTRIWNYETHMPRFFEKRKMLEVIHLYKAAERRLLLPTLYFNHHFKGQEPEILSPHDDCKVIFTGRNDGQGVPPAATTNEVKALIHYKQATIGKHFLNHNNRGMADPAMQYLRHALWPEPSTFEGKQHAKAS